MSESRRARKRAAREHGAAKAPQRKRRTVVFLAALLGMIGFLFWQRGPAGPLVLLHQGTIAQSRWVVVAQEAADSDVACLQVRVDGARRELMCDRHWGSDGGVNLRVGVAPESPTEASGPVSLLRIAFPGSDDILVVTVVPREIATMRLAGAGGGTDLTVRRLLRSDHSYVTQVVKRDQLGEVRAADARGLPLHYQFLDDPSIRSGLGRP